MVEPNLFDGLNEDQAMIDLGRAVVPFELGAIPRSNEYFASKAKEWLVDRSSHIQERVCASARIRELSTNSTSAELVAAVTGAVESFVSGSAVSPLVIVICKIGCWKLCHRKWNLNATE